MDWVFHVLSPNLKSQYEVIIVGGGFAGAATAWALSELGIHDVLLLEKERVCGVHSSGRNAGMIRTAVEDPVLATLAREGHLCIVELAATGRVRFDPCGSLIIGADRVPTSVTDDTRHQFISADKAVDLVPLLHGDHAGLDSALLHTPTDGIVEVDSLLQEFIAQSRAGGATVAFGVEAARPVVSRRRVQGVTLEGSTIRARHVVVAAGAWCAEWGVRAGVPVRLEPRRRHIVCTRDPEGLSSKRWPWVWDIEAGFYFRPESSGLLWSPCDESADRAGSCVADPEAAQWLAEKVTGRLPRALELATTRSWAGHRTFAPDGRFLLGPDPRLEGWHWAAGLGGHGVTVASAVGRRVAAAVAGAIEIEPSLAYRPSVGERIAS